MRRFGLNKQARRSDFFDSTILVAKRDPGACKHGRKPACMSHETHIAAENLLVGSHSRPWILRRTLREDRARVREAAVKLKINNYQVNGIGEKHSVCHPHLCREVVSHAIDFVIHLAEKCEMASVRRRHLADNLPVR